jgi:hypothetical protein
MLAAIAALTTSANGPPTVKLLAGDEQADGGHAHDRRCDPNRGW